MQTVGKLMLPINGRNCKVTWQGGTDTRKGEGLKSFFGLCHGQLPETCLQSPCSHTYSHTCCNKVTWRASPFLITRMRTQMGSKCQSHIILSSWPSLLYFLATPFHKAQSIFAPCSLISAIKHQDAFTPHLRGLQAGELAAPKPETWVC